MIGKVVYNYNKIVMWMTYRQDVIYNQTIVLQRSNPKSIPVIIINYNQLYYLKKLIDFLVQRKFEKIIILDNNSSYAPLLKYYKTIQNIVQVEHLGKNYGHQALYQAPNIHNKYCKGYYFLTDADIIPNKDLPENFPEIMIQKLEKYFLRVTKVGFALEIDDIPDYYKLKKEVQKWEKKFWLNEVEPNIYLTSIDTTFALYKPNYKNTINNEEFIKGLRLAGKFTARHGGWYTDIDNLSPEEVFYIQTANKSASWTVSKDGSSKAGYECKENRHY